MQVVRTSSGFVALTTLHGMMESHYQTRSRRRCRSWSPLETSWFTSVTSTVYQTTTSLLPALSQWRKNCKACCLRTVHVSSADKGTGVEWRQPECHCRWHMVWFCCRGNGSSADHRHRHRTHFRGNARLPRLTPRRTTQKLASKS
jgi:hypothetical protein